jgi:4-amino-4-deoxy-L-arabinose transferase-like glycosyltransferase
MKPSRIQKIRWLDSAATLFIGLGLGYILLHWMEWAAIVAWVLCGLGAMAKMLAASMASRVSDADDL